MLKARFISAVIALVLLFIVTALNTVVFNITFAIVGVVCIYEFYHSLKHTGINPVKPIGYISCIPLFLIALEDNIGLFHTYVGFFKSVTYFSLAVFACIVLLFSISIVFHKRYNLQDIALTVFGAVYVSFLFSFVILTRNLPYGRFFVWFIFIGAFTTDTFAFFAGKVFGRIKILPEISPKKTLEGSIGGALGCVLCTILFGYLLDIMQWTPKIPVYHYVILGLVNGLLSQIGDWSASAIKRFAQIKDFGNVMPGHGGVLDRFDSILFVAPVVYFYISLVIL